MPSPHVSAIFLKGHCAYFHFTVVKSLHRLDRPMLKDNQVCTQPATLDDPALDKLQFKNYTQARHGTSGACTCMFHILHFLKDSPTPGGHNRKTRLKIANHVTSYIYNS